MLQFRVRIMFVILLIYFSSANPSVHNHKIGTGASNMTIRHLSRSPVVPQLSRMRIIDSIPAPPGEMIMGLTEDSDFLWIFTNTTNSYSVFYKIKKTDGSIIRQFNFPDTTPRYNIGLTMINGYLYTSEFYPVPGNIHILDTLGNLIRTFNTGYDTRGLTWDGTNLWTTEADSMSILKMDTLGNVIATYKNNGTIQWFMDITYDDIDSTIWANDDAFALNINEIAVYSSPFYIIQSFDHPSSENDIPEGITLSNESDGSYLYTSSAYSQYIWKIKVHDGAIEENNKKHCNQYHFKLNTGSLFRNQIWINFKIPADEQVKLNVYGIDGSAIQTLKNEILRPGEYSILWESKDVPAGLYFLRLETPDYKSTIKVIKLK
ncbi:MAG: hypothetical protein ACUVQT_10840 [bacterium]